MDVIEEELYNWFNRKNPAAPLENINEYLEAYNLLVEYNLIKHRVLSTFYDFLNDVDDFIYTFHPSNMLIGYYLLRNLVINDNTELNAVIDLCYDYSIFDIMEYQEIEGILYSDIPEIKELIQLLLKYVIKPYFDNMNTDKEEYFLKYCDAADIKDCVKENKLEV